MKYVLKPGDCNACVYGIDGKPLEGVFTYDPSVGNPIGPLGKRQLTVKFSMRGESTKSYIAPNVKTIDVQVVPSDGTSTGTGSCNR